MTHSSDTEAHHLTCGCYEGPFGDVHMAAQSVQCDT